MISRSREVAAYPPQQKPTVPILPPSALTASMNLTRIGLVTADYDARWGSDDVSRAFPSLSGKETDLLTLPVLCDPRTKACGHFSTIYALLDECGFGVGLQWRDRLEETLIDIVSIKEIRNEDAEPLLGVLVGKDANVVELVAEDVCDKDYGLSLVLGASNVGRETTDGLLAPFGSARVQVARDAAARE